MLGRAARRGQVCDLPFRSLLHARHHPANHEEVERLADEVVDQRAAGTKQSEASRRSRSDPATVALTDEQSRAVVTKRPENERPCADDERAVGFENRHWTPDVKPAHRSRIDAVADLDVPELRVDTGRGVRALDVVHRAEDEEALNPVVAVEASPAVADLHQPWPHDVGRSVDCERAGVVCHEVFDDVIAGRRRIALVVVGSPAQHPRPDERVVTDECQDAAHRPPAARVQAESQPTGGRVRRG